MMSGYNRRRDGGTDEAGYSTPAYRSGNTGNFSSGNPEYENANYGNANYGNADYQDANYGNANYGNTNYGNANYGNADCQDANYGNANYGNANYQDANYGNADCGNTNYGSANYGNANYRDANSGNMNYGNADYGNADPQGRSSGRLNPAGASGGGKKRGGSFGKGFLSGMIAAALVIIVVVGAAKLLSSGSSYGTYASGSISEEDVSEKLDMLNSLIDDYYLYADEVDADALIDGIYSGYVDALGDVYTVYYDEEETANLLDSTTGTFSGIGATLTEDADTGAVTIINVYTDSPAEEAGIQAGDILLQVDDNVIGDEDLSTIVTWIKGEEGTEVTLYVERDGEELELTAVRAPIEVETVTYEMLDNQIGYIAITEFDTVTVDQFTEAMDALENDGMEALIVDLRDNPGGTLSAVTEILEELLPEGVIVSTVDKDGYTEEYTSTGDNEFTKPFAVLVNENSASASEIFAGAVQDYGIGTIVGETTYGKGIVQQLMDLGDGTYLKVTISEYYTPNGRSINGEGITPDVEVEYEADADDADADNQLDAAVEVIENEL